MHQAFTGPKIESWNHCNRVTIPAAVCSVQGSQDVAKAEVAEAETSAALILLVTTWLRTWSIIRQNHVVFARYPLICSNPCFDISGTTKHFKSPKPSVPAQTPQLPNSKILKPKRPCMASWKVESGQIHRVCWFMLVHCYRRPQKGDIKKHHIIYNF